jgi:hypothetical protein
VLAATERCDAREVITRATIQYAAPIDFGGTIPAFDPRSEPYPNSCPERRPVLRFVLGAVAPALYWVFLVPIFQAPDEAEHFDLRSLNLNGAGDRNRTRDLLITNQQQALLQAAHPCKS